MSFYSLLAQYYESLFPVSKSKEIFFSNRLKDSKTVLDIGCATGAFSLDLHLSGLSVTGIDADTEMIKAASKHPGPEFITCRMEDISTTFNPQSFDTILCLGNTLPHLKVDQLEHFLADCYQLLTKPAGQLVIQTVNFDKIINTHNPFPVIETEHLVFKRNYSQQDDNTVRFSYSIYSKKMKKEFSSHTQLSILKSNYLKNLIVETGFQHVNLLGNFNEDPYSLMSDACIALCRI